LPQNQKILLQYVITAKREFFSPGTKIRLVSVARSFMSVVCDGGTVNANLYKRIPFVFYLLLFWIQIEAVNVCDKFMF